jgi:hypothetical protein
MIWSHADLAKLEAIDRQLIPPYDLDGIGLSYQKWNISECKFCNTVLRNFDSFNSTGYSKNITSLLVCDTCGWWIINDRSGYSGRENADYFSWLYPSWRFDSNAI